MIEYRKIYRKDLQIYDKVPMLVHVTSEYKLKKLDGGFGGILLEEKEVDIYEKDLSVYEKAAEYEKKFDISNWAFFMAFHDEKPVGAVTIASRTPGVDMLDGRDDLAVLWDIRVNDQYKHRGIGQRLFNLAKEWAIEQSLRQIKIECQNNNVPACKFYKKQGAKLCKIDEYAYYSDESAKNEVQLIFYLDL